MEIPRTELTGQEIYNLVDALKISNFRGVFCADEIPPEEGEHLCSHLCRHLCSHLYSHLCRHPHSLIHILNCDSTFKNIFRWDPLIKLVLIPAPFNIALFGSIFFDSFSQHAINSVDLLVCLL